jgi:hypothetical protein
VARLHTNLGGDKKYVTIYRVKVKQSLYRAGQTLNAPGDLQNFKTIGT